MYTGLNSFADLKDRGEAVVLDCETTGTDTDTDRIIQVAAIRMDLSKWSQIEENTFYQYESYTITLDPGQPIPRSATKVHGIRDSDIIGKPKFKDIAEELREWIGDRPIIGHNIQFDKQIINAEFKRAGVKSISRKGFCTMWRYREWNDGIRKGSGLDNVARTLGVKGRKTRRHEALEDAEIVSGIAQLFYLNDTGWGDCLPTEKPGLDRGSKGAYSEEFGEADGCAWIGTAGVILFVIFLISTCS